MTTPPSQRRRETESSHLPMQSQSETQRLSSLLKALFIGLCQILQCYPMPALMMVMTAKKDQSKPLGFEKGFSKAKFFIAGKLIQAINALFEHLLVFTKTRIPSFFPHLLHSLSPCSVVYCPEGELKCHFSHHFFWSAYPQPNILTLPCESDF